MDNYRNKSVLGLDYIINNNNVSSLISIKIANCLVDLKKEHNLQYIKNATIRNDEYQVLVKLDIKGNNFNIMDQFTQSMIIDKLYKICIDNKYTLRTIIIELGEKAFSKRNPLLTIYGDSYIIFNLIICELPLKFYIDGYNYFQINNYILPELYGYIYNVCNNIPIKNLICIGDDSGNISIILSKIYDKLKVFIPCDKSYFAAKQNILLNNINNLELFNDGKEYMSAFTNEYQNCVLLINPGRKGISDDNINYINDNDNIKYIVYMSCKPMTLNNNLKKLVYKLKSIKPFNMFNHIENYCENVVVLERNLLN